MVTPGEATVRNRQTRLPLCTRSNILGLKCDFYHPSLLKVWSANCLTAFTSVINHGDFTAQNTKEQYYLPKEHRRKNIIIFILLKNKSKKPIQLRFYMAQTYLGKRENKPYWS